ncbi:hypothetical protein [Anaeromyxobacter diazotrophicus]|uniref:Cytochrome c-552/4 domain-containing protein n=1 Tax=Anaeromyxobacter diazotrophicus TaxID=2590199 RepID=A0A7I9VQL4_9BACT|nr:hypothetical protein [Anaeromyxobacter diazotrophicus]GEJ58713.1 hypothetical protein AMYX_34540 [Anaeromyxobacter diazotrophicus]
MNGSKWIAALATLALAATGCQGAKGESSGTGGQDGVATQDAAGTPGPAGSQGPAGKDGKDGLPGISTGMVIGTVTSASASKAGVPVAGVTVSFDPDPGVTATTDADGNFGATVPVGVYTVTFTKNPGIAATSFSNISVIAGGKVCLEKALPYSPLALTLTGATSWAGLGKLVALGASTTGATGPVSYAWKLTAGPFKKGAAPALAVSPDGAQASFTTALLAEIIASGVVNNPPLDLPPRPSFVAISPGQAAKMSYTVSVTATDGTFSQTATATVGTLPFTPGLAETAPRGLPLVANDALAAHYAWQLASRPAGSAAALDLGGVRNPVFVPDVDGQYVLTNGATQLAVTVNGFVGLGKIADDGARHGCSNCHVPYFQPPKAKEWKNSAHGNHFFKFMHYEGDALVWNLDPVTLLPVPAPTANEGKVVSWSQPGRMTTFEFGMTGAEGTHYGANCVACHTTGYGGGANGGFDDVALATGWKFPTAAQLEAAFGGTASTPAPVFALWNAIPSELKGLVGMQCEACHGPMGEHAQNPINVTAAKGFFGVDSCAACHDRPTNHDRVALWRKSGHATLTNGEFGAMDVGVEASCSRCHAGQGHKLWADNGFGTSYVPPADENGTATLWGKGDVQPITCQACHDPHTTTLRLEGEAPLALLDGYTVEGMGTGASCMVCHNGRKKLPASPNGMGAHESSQTDVFVGVNAFFVNPSQPSAHLAVADTCVGCHMKVKSAVKDGTTPSNTNHTFAIDATRACQACHGAAASAEGLEEAFDASLAALWKAMGDKITGALPAVYNVVAQDPAGLGDAQAETHPKAVTLDQKPVSVKQVRSYHPYTLFVFGFATPIPDPFHAGLTTTELWIKTGDIDVSAPPAPIAVTPGTVASDGAVTADAEYTIATPLVAKGGVIAKACWNSVLLTNDKSKGLHNPDFAFDVLAASRAQVVALPATAPAGGF